MNIELKPFKDVNMNGHKAYLCKDDNGFFIADVKPLSKAGYWGFIDRVNKSERAPEMAAQLD